MHDKPDAAPGPLSVVIAEGEDLLRALLEAALSGSGDVHVAAAVPDGESAIEAARRLHPAVVLLDTALRGSVSGIEAGLLIRREFPDTGIVWLSTHKRPYLPVSFQQTTGWAYLLKTSGTDVRALVTTVRGVAKGLVVTDPEIAALSKRLLDAWLPRLTLLQHDVLALMAQGLSNAAIARVLNLPEKSVEGQINHIYGRLGLQGKATATHPRVAAALAYIRAGAEEAGPASAVARGEGEATPGGWPTASQRPHPLVLEHAAFRERVQEEIARCLRTRRHFSVLLRVEAREEAAPAQGPSDRPDAGLGVASELVQRVRGYDLVGLSDAAEVLLLFPETTREDVGTILVRLRGAAAGPPAPAPDTPPPRWGVATWPGDGADFAALLDAARQRLSAA
jgi:DNA-binding NarL/FixJ family response regulator